jgi:hypothetical protein
VSGLALCPVFPTGALAGGGERARLRIQVHCISGPCHPPLVRGGSVLLLILRVLLRCRQVVLTPKPSCFGIKTGSGKISHPPLTHTQASEAEAEVGVGVGLEERGEGAQGEEGVREAQEAEGQVEGERSARKPIPPLDSIWGPDPSDDQSSP